MKANYKNESLLTFILMLGIDEGLKIKYPLFSLLANLFLAYPASIAQVE